ncbi:uncharacterized protein LOC107411196 [Ziziphus jujuba]|uniref:Uncharacterized protein LOC107411196 n=2 Tax=Ziziphus jujuba TaxID=326968 RepID=A0A6P6FZW6_ZIZJJ|nr:uncharacterized protein LOC107411196 [Ziziphus jujuba]XP_048336025.1 uncharacterized protein LOC107411196 [Ziziphus jujuba var. spinosa]KAH7517931.1 hypothetical protein FEM48_Zijuj09G0116500 [Ziziphus jujuba var. spinosa]
MANLYPSNLLSASTRFKASTEMALKTHHHPFLQGFKEGFSQYDKKCHYSSSFIPSGLFQNSGPKVMCAMNMASGQSDDPGKTKLERLQDMAIKLWESTPAPVKSFPWNRAFDNFVQLILDLILAVVRYLSVPLLVVSSLSEISYCAHEKKLFLMPVPLLIGIAVAEVLRQTALDVSPLLKDAEVPWHLICMAILFTLLKLAGPSLPYWGRIFVPHFANGGLFRTLWAFWQRRKRH